MTIGNEANHPARRGPSRWKKYAAAAPAVAAPLALPLAADAIPIAVSGTVAQGYFAIIGPQTDVLFSHAIVINQIVFRAGGRTAAASQAAISLNYPVTTTNPVRSEYGGHLNWPSDTSQYFAFNLAGGGQGWIHVNTGFNGAPITYRGAYDTEATPNNPLHVGTVPEPSSFAFLGMLATGAAGVAALKKYRREEQVGENEAEVV